MYTVIILNKKSSDLIQDYKFLFKPFVDKGIIGFCDWNEAGTDVKTAVPDLYDLIKGKRDWRALVVNTDSVYGYKNCYVPKKSNPFDYSETDDNTIPHESNVPMIRIAQMIGGYTATLTKEFEKGFEFFNEEKGEKDRIKESDLTEDELNLLSEQHDDLVAVYIEKEIPAEIKKAQQEMVEKYCFAEVRPTEIDLVATRRKVDNKEKLMVEESWRNHLEMTSSNFWEVNKYPNNSRFLAYDIANSDNSFYKREMAEFWFSVLTLAINKVAASTLQAYRLYRISVDVSEEELGKTLNEHLNKMNSAYAFIKEQIQLRPETSFDEEDELVHRQIIPVTIDKNDAKELMMSFEHIGICRDWPQDEASVWTIQLRQKKTALDRYFKLPRRAIDKSANYMKNRAESFRGESYVLDKFQLDDLNEKMNELEYDIISSEVKSAIDKKSVDVQLKEIDKNVRKSLGQRLSKRAVFACSTAVLLFTLFGYLPYLISAARSSAKTFVAALVVVLFVILSALLGGLVALLVQRGELVSLMGKFNTLMRNVGNSMRSMSQRFETYFSDICTYMRAVSILEGTKKKNVSSDSQSNILLVHKKAISAAIDKDTDWIISYDVKRVEDVISNVTVFFDVNLLPRNNPMYYFEENLEEDDMPINSTGDKLTSPYKFIKKLWIEREDIFDEVEE